MRKRRTRSHVLAGLSANHVERYALLCGYSVERFEHDYGIDLALYTYSPEGEVENGAIYLQLKATDDLQTLQDNQTVALEVERSDLEYWLEEPMPVILVLYDASADVAYWLYVQPYMNSTLNYGELVALLRQLGFRSVRSSGPQKVFQNSTFDALIVLPPFSAAEPVRPHHLATVRKLVIDKGIADTQAFDRLLENRSLAKA